MADPLVQAAQRMYADFPDRTTLAANLAVLARARNDLDTPSAAALPELVERLARQRLADGLASPATSNGSTPDEHPAEPRRCDRIICSGRAAPAQAGSSSCQSR